MRDENIANQTWQESKFIEGTLVPRGGKTDMEKIHMKLESFLKRRPKEKIKKNLKPYRIFLLHSLDILFFSLAFSLD